MVTDVEQGESGGEVYGVVIQEIPVDTIECVVEQHTG